MKKRLIIALAAIAAAVTLIAVLPPSTQALTSTTTMNFSMLLQGTCSVTASSVVIPPYANMQSMDNTADGTISVFCPLSQMYNIDIDGGLHLGMAPGHPSSRALADPLNYTHIAYRLNWIDPWTQTPMGPAGFPDGGNTWMDWGTGATQNFTVRVTVPAFQNGNTGLTYTDSATVTVIY